jgi:Right handed beta helix region
MRTRLAIVLGFLMWHPVAHAASFSVTTTDDTVPGSLRAAVLSANRAPGNNTIVISATGTLNLAAPLEALSPSVGSTLTITGPGAGQLTIRPGAGTFTVFVVSGAVQLSGMTIKDGQNNGGGNGGGISVGVGASLVLIDSVVSGNSASAGGGIYSNGPLTIQRSTISGNSGGGGVYAADTTRVIDSTIANNQGTGLVFPTAGRALIIDRSTISGNTDASGVGGLDLLGGTATISNTTFSGNTGLQAGDFWIHPNNNVMLSLTNVTASGSSAPGLLLDSPSTVTLRNTVFAGVGARCNPGSLATSRGHNLSSDTTCHLTDPTDKPNIAPLLGALAANGGASKTHAPLAGSPALNGGDATGVETLDQRGMPRVQFAAVDIGAIEVSEPAISTQPMPQDLTEGDALMLAVAATNPNSAVPLTFQWRKDGAPIAGATGATWTKPDARLADSGMYDVVVTNEGGGLPSAAVMVSVHLEGEGGGGGGGCCSATGRGAWPDAALGLVLAALLVPRRRRATKDRG